MNYSLLTYCTLIAFVFTAAEALPVVIAQPAPDLLPPPAPQEDGRLFVVKFKVFHVDGIKAALAEPKGFRRFVRGRCEQIGLSGYVWRVPNVHGKILAKGTRDQISALLCFVRELQHYGFIETFEVEQVFSLRALTSVQVPDSTW